jgi:hypothetical protein
MQNQSPHRFLEQTILTVFLWIGIWGTVSLFLDHYVHSFDAKLLVYMFMVSVSFSLLHMREHIQP